MRTLKFGPGKFYRLRNAMKYRCYAVDGGGKFPVHGAALTGEGWEVCSHTLQGFFISDKKERKFDIISEWVDELDFDVSCLPAWSNRFISMDQSGFWWTSQNEPTRSDAGGGWITCGVKIPAEFAPKNYSGSWKDSLHKIINGKAVQFKEPKNPKP